VIARALPLAEHTAMREAELGPLFGDELAREAQAFLSAHDALREVRSSRYCTRLNDYLRATKPTTRMWEATA
jgi:hypothetical protein